MIRKNHPTVWKHWFYQSLSVSKPTNGSPSHLEWSAKLSEGPTKSSSISTPLYLWSNFLLLYIYYEAPAYVPWSISYLSLYISSSLCQDCFSCQYQHASLCHFFQTFTHFTKEPFPATLFKIFISDGKMMSTSSAVLLKLLSCFIFPRSTHHLLCTVYLFICIVNISLQTKATHEQGLLSLLLTAVSTTPETMPNIQEILNKYFFFNKWVKEWIDNWNYGLI